MNRTVHALSVPCAVAVACFIAFASQSARGSTVATPTFSPSAGTYTSVQTVTINDSTSGATIYYTTDGSTPTTSSARYTSAITVSSSETIKAIGTKSGYTQSAVGSAAYTINLPAATPTFSPAAGTYTSAQTVTISDSTPGATIYYTTNGSTPTTSSTRYTAPISITSTKTVKAIATASGYSQSAVGSATYTINLTAATPTFSPGSGSYSATQTVTVSDSTSGATIYYTTDGSTPTTSSTKYTAALTVNATLTINAIATASGYATSAVGSAAYTITTPAAPTPVFSPGAGTFGYYAPPAVTISDSNPNATIYYTEDGTTPTPSSEIYSGPIAIYSTETLEAIASVPGDLNSSVASAVYTIQAATPSFSPSAGSYVGAQIVTLSDDTNRARIYYTTDGTTPTTSSTRYSSAITVSSTETIKAIATASVYATSPVNSAAYTITSTPATPTFSPAAGTYKTPQLVTISDSSLNATIYYTVTNGTTGTTPTTSSTAYTGAITVGSTQTLEAIAAVTGYTPSASATATYTLPAPTSTTTTLAMSVAGNPVSSASFGSVVQLKAAVSAGGTAITTGTVNFCDASAPKCTDIHLFGTAQITSAGSATLFLKPGVGSYSYKALFTGTLTSLTSSSSASPLTITGQYPTSTTIDASSGALVANVSGFNGQFATYPTGNVSILDVNNNNGVLTTAALSAYTPILSSTNALNMPLTGTIFGTDELIATGDFNQDGNQDFAVLTNQENVIIMLGNGDGTFVPASGSPITEYGYLVATGDLNGDGRPDLVIAGDEYLTALLGNGDGTFTQVNGGVATCMGPVALSVNDFNRDGKLDLAVACSSTFFGGRPAVMILAGNGDGTFTVANGGPVSLDANASGIVAGDFNNDGITDLAVSESSEIAILVGIGDGTFMQASGSPISVNQELGAIVAGDFDKDGNLDIAVADYYYGNVPILTGKGDGTFTVSMTNSTGIGPYSLAVADFDGDGLPDIAVAYDPDIMLMCQPASSCPYQSTVQILKNSGNGGFYEATTVAMQGGPQSLAVTDFNSDGIPDIASVNYGDGVNSGTVAVLKTDSGLTSKTTITGIPHTAGGTGIISARYESDTNYQGSTSTTVPIQFPWITGISPASGMPGTFVSITGSAFGQYAAGKAAVTFNGTAAEIANWTPTAIEAVAPGGVTAGPVVVTNMFQSNGVLFAVPTLPTITGISPAFGSVGSTVTISGYNFGTSSGIVTFNGVPGTITSWGIQAVIATVPTGATTGPVIITAGGVMSYGYNFSIAPNVVGIAPNSGSPNTQVTITGTGFGSTQGTSSVTFVGVPAVSLSWTDTSIIVRAPSGALTGNVAVVVNGMTATGPIFTFSPSLSNIYPATGPIGTSVTLSGTNFGPTQSASNVLFGTVAASPTKWSQNSIAVPVPTGATTGPVFVNVNGQSSNSLQFTVGPPIVGSITGTVTQPDGVTAISGAIVDVVRGNNVVACGTTNFSGAYSISALSVDTYTVRASASGFGVASQTNVAVSSGQATVVNFTLTGQTTITYGYDELGRLVSVNDPANGAATYTYDPVGNILSISRTSENQEVSRGPAAKPATKSAAIVSGAFSATTTKLAKDVSIAPSVVNAQAVTATPTGTGSISLAVSNTSSPRRGSPVVDAASGKLSIVSLSPQIASAGQSVMLTGIGFDSLVNDRVKFNGVIASLNAATPTTISATVPANAQSGQVSIKTPLGSAISKTDLFVIPAAYSPSQVDFMKRIPADGGTFAGTLAAGGGLGLAIFDVDSGQQFSLVVTDCTIQGAVISVISPTGTVLATASINTDGVRFNQIFAPVKGTYSALITNGGSARTGSMTIRLTRSDSGPDPNRIKPMATP